MLLLIQLAALLVAPAGTALAHGGEDHGAATVAPQSAQGTSSSMLTTDAVTEQFELLMKYLPPAAGRNTTLRLFLSDYVTNRPMEGAAFTLAFKPAGVKVVQPPSMISPGVYSAVVSFPLDTVYSMVATVAAERRTDFLELRNIYTGEHATRFLAGHGGGAAAQPTATGGSTWAIAGISLAVLALAGLAGWFIVRRRKRGAAVSTQGREIV